MNRGHVPTRTCVICRRSIAKRSLLRLVAHGDAIIADPAQREPGRGAYLCDQSACRLVAVKRLPKALKVSARPVLLEATLAEVGGSR